MIGVICRNGQSNAVEEFFQLFKTPWEYYDADRAYDVILCTDDAALNTDAKLLIVYGSDSNHLDIRYGLRRQALRTGQRLKHRNWDIPIHGPLAFFSPQALRGSSRPLPVVQIDGAEPRKRIIRVGYDLFDETAHLLTVGQPADSACIPALELHIAMLRSWIVGAAQHLVEIPPVPAGYDLAVCLTHDVDFLRISNHMFSRTMLGFVYRASVGSLLDALRRRTPWSRFRRNILAVASLPWACLQLCEDFWLQFEEYARIEEGLGATYFFIPFKGRAGERVTLLKPGRRAAAYDIQEAKPWVKFLVQKGHEVAVHGIDAWHDVRKGRLEREAVAQVAGTEVTGIRIHWLCFDSESPQILEDAGYSYDSTFGYNDTIGFRAGTAQVFRPLGTQRILEMPLHIQDMALFSPSYMNLNDDQAEQKCREIVNRVRTHGGVLNILWHHRSLGPERLWRDFYVRLLDHLKEHRVWFGTAAQVAHWFRLRRAISFRRGSLSEGGLILRLDGSTDRSNPPFVVRMYTPLPDQADPGRTSAGHTDISWSGENSVSIPLPRERCACS